MSLNSVAEDELELLLALLNFCISAVINCIWKLLETDDEEFK
jgi:hypothetical protein